MQGHSSSLLTAWINYRCPHKLQVSENRVLRKISGPQERWKQMIYDRHQVMSDYSRLDM